MNSKVEVDIVTHMAICATVNLVTASQPQRKWYTKVIVNVAAGGYRLGANSANIIVQNQLMGELEEEKMQVYVRLGIRLLYKGWRNRIEGGRGASDGCLYQGIKFDSPESARNVSGFIKFHKLNVDEMLYPIFFYRELKPDARPVKSPEDPYRIASGADCRLMAFKTVNEATKLWIKGHKFSIPRLLGDTYKYEADCYNGGALCIFRLAPQDYHQFHSFVDGMIESMTYISGEYYTVNPQAIRTALDVYGENARKIVLATNTKDLGHILEGEDDEDILEEEAIARAIEMSMKEGQGQGQGDKKQTEKKCTMIHSFWKCEWGVDMAQKGQQRGA
ncbi:phosphatidylserine decarboxylase-domain-containing protein [Irpex rosettiformis]|uniref:Phosphatidylserine decarboxylase-domain-containing protein n=1 Tax=Irpex rosettiformis TaxID=378272 RepID=A0ACB8U569_9APHY|nr:phosphatidylserine decarboxylase-domain-containing protein [Irpex rosettiformis]